MKYASSQNHQLLSRSIAFTSKAVLAVLFHSAIRSLHQSMILIETMSHTQPRQACDRCHGQKLRCKRGGSDASCTRCLKAGVVCVSRPSLRSKKVRHRSMSGAPTIFGSLGPSNVGEEITQISQGASTVLANDWGPSSAQQRGQSSSTTYVICKCIRDRRGTLGT